jgi:transmembrane sensor
MEKKNYEFIHKIRFKNNIVLTESDVKASFENIKKRIDNGKTIELPVAKKVILFKSIQFRVAATIAILLTLGFTGLNYYNNQKVCSFANTTNDVKQFVLPDGSQIDLRAKSTLLYRKNFLNKRNVELQGEALFSVTKDKKSPFTVTTKQGTVTVLGTVFTVRALNSENYTKAVLKEGSIQFSAIESDKTALLKPGEEALITQGSNEISIRKVKNMDRALAWKTRKFNFENEALGDILHAISDAYNKKLDLSISNLKQNRYTLKFNHGEDLPKMLDVLSDIGTFQYKIENNKITIISK